MTLLRSPVEVCGVHAFEDNYIWIVRNVESGEVAVVDPGAAMGVLDMIRREGWTLIQVWNTHWHADHVGGNGAIKQHIGARIIAPALDAPRISVWDDVVHGGETFYLGNVPVEVLAVPGHTVGHIAFYLPSCGTLFPGDTLFAMGCGRLFEGSAEEMWLNMQLLASLPNETSVYCAHEYTLTNARFAHSIDPGNLAIERRLAEVETLRRDDCPTIPTTIGLEKATNPFMQAKSATELAKLRAARDKFKDEAPPIRRLRHGEVS